jgi:hypothetical protein
MTRASLNRTLRRAYLVLGLVLAVSLASKFADQIPGIAGTRFERTAAAVYDYLRDMALVLVTVVAAYLANVFQKRSNFVESLEEEWRGIVRTKSALYTFCEKQYASTDDYLAAFCRISETIDNMRIVYRNAGETETLVGIYPFVPLHDMRRALQSIDPRKRTDIAIEEKKLARDAILQSFYALRENFLEELDLDEPTNPLLISRSLRSKVRGHRKGAGHELHRQSKAQTEMRRVRLDVDNLLLEQLRLEQEKDGVAADQRDGDRERQRRD